MVTKLEEFSTRVANSALGITNENHGIDIVTIQAIIAMVAQIVAMFQNCPKPPSPATIANPSWIQKLQFRLLTRSVVSESPNPLIRSMSAKIAEAALAEAGKMKVDEVTLVLDESAAISNWLV